MKKIILLFALLFLFGCSKDNPTENIIPKSGLKLIQSTYTDNIYPADSNIKNYTYTNNTISKYELIHNDNSKEIIEYGYDGTKMKTWNYYDLSILNVKSNSYIRTFNYTGNLVTNSVGVGTTQDKDIYSYNSNNQMIHRESYMNNTLSDAQNYEFNLEGNVSKQYFVGHLPDANIYEYDNKKNPYYLIYDSDFLKIFEATGSKNNIIKEGINTYEYVYNSEGYPTQKIEKTNGVVQSKTTYTYQ